MGLSVVGDQAQLAVEKVEIAGALRVSMDYIRTSARMEIRQQAGG